MNASEVYNWHPNLGDPRLFAPRYTVHNNSQTTVVAVRQKFANLPSAGIWADRVESDDDK